MQRIAIGPRLRQLREQRGLSQTALAEASGLHPSYISRVESGRTRRPYRPNLERIADALSCRVEELYVEALYLPASLEDDACAPGDLAGALQEAEAALLSLSRVVKRLRATTGSD